jgi:hypothetical protein
VKNARRTLAAAGIDKYFQTKMAAFPLGDLCGGVRLLSGLGNMDT